MLGHGKSTNKNSNTPKKSSRRRMEEMKQTIAAKDTELRQKQREIDQLYGKLAAGRWLGEHEMGP